MKRYQVIRKDVRYNRQTYHTGELLPMSFSEKDKYRLLYPSRIALVEVPDSIDVSTPSVAEQKIAMAGMKAQNVQTQATAKAPTPGTAAKSITPAQGGAMKK